MGDIYIKPNTEEVEKLREYLGDPFLWHLTKNIIKSLNEKKIIMDCESTWFSLTRQMFKNYPALEVYDKIYKAMEEASDEQWFEHKYPRGFFNEDWKYSPKKKSAIKINLKKSRIKKLINDNLKITQVAKNYGIEVKNNMAKCPFHEEKQASLSLSDKKNVFMCFGCGAKGNIIEFIRRMEEIKDGNKR